MEYYELLIQIFFGLKKEQMLSVTSFKSVAPWLEKTKRLCFPIYFCWILKRAKFRVCNEKIFQQREGFSNLLFDKS